MIFTNKGKWNETAQKINNFLIPYAAAEIRKCRSEGLNIRQCIAKAAINMPKEVLATIDKEGFDTLEVHCIWIGIVECIGLDKILDNEGW